MVLVITKEVAEGRLDWASVVEAIRAGHLMPPAEVSDLFLGDTEKTLLTRAAHHSTLGFGVKAVTVCVGNKDRGLPSVQGFMTLFDAETGAVDALIENDLVTKWKTAGDSVLGAKLLARSDARTLLILGAGSVAESLVHSYSSALPKIDRILVWTRSAVASLKFAEKLANDGMSIEPVLDLKEAADKADVISSATMAKTPILAGDWVRPGTHVDLIGAFKADMREADDELLLKSAIFVDNRETVLDHIGELKIPLNSGVLKREDIKGDLYDLVVGTAGRQSNEEITLFKNGGGAHLDLMVSRYIFNRVKENCLAPGIRSSLS